MSRCVGCRHALQQVQDLCGMTTYKKHSSSYKVNHDLEDTELLVLTALVIHAHL